MSCCCTPNCEHLILHCSNYQMTTATASKCYIVRFETYQYTIQRRNLLNAEEDCDRRLFLLHAIMYKA